MDSIWTPYCIPPLLLGMVMAALAVYAWRNRASPVSVPFTVVLAAVSVWLLSTGLRTLTDLLQLQVLLREGPPVCASLNHLHNRGR